LLEYGSSKAVLRECVDKGTADKYCFFGVHLNGFLPQILRREGSRVYYEYLNGRDCVREDADRVALQIGRISGFVRRIPPFGCNFEPDKEFQRASDYLEGHIGWDMSWARKMYSKLRARIEPIFGTDLNDIIPSNFRLVGERVYLIDVHGINSGLVVEELQKQC